jgi:hypothetical protein
MGKQKSFYELKVLPQQPVFINPPANGRQGIHISGDIKGNAILMKNTRVSASSPQIRKMSVVDRERPTTRIITK